MNERVHVYSWPIDRAFTFKEWCDYLDKRELLESTSEVVAEFGGWKFNVHGVCLNRKKAVQQFIGRSGGVFRVEVYQAPKAHKLGNPLAWNYTTDWSDGTSGGGGGYREVKGDETDAIIAGLDAIAKKFDDMIQWYQSSRNSEENYPGKVKICKEGARMARMEIADRQQLTLF